MPKIETLPSIPPAARLAQELRRQIRARQYAVGEQLPTERELGERTGMSRRAVRQALATLEKERLIVRQHGRGSFVADPVHGRVLHKDMSLIGIITPDRKDFERSLRAAATRASQLGYSAATAINASAEVERQQVEGLLEHNIKGVIMTPCLFSVPNYLRLLDENLPVVFIDYMLRDYVEDYVIQDNWRGIWLAVKHLVELGHRRIAYVGHDRRVDFPVRRDRLRGYQDACEEFGVNPPEEWIIESSESAVGARIRHLLQQPNRPTAIVAYNDTWAILAADIALELGLSIPVDVSVTGFDDGLEARDYKVPLTTISSEMEEMGRVAASTLINKIEHPEPRSKQGIVIAPSLVARKSTAKAREA